MLEITILMFDIVQFAC